jgi:CRISPR-associated endonuclease/helicase Cas3
MRSVDAGVPPEPAEGRDFAAFFRQATGHEPHGFQARIARDGLPSLVRAPTGTGKTGIVLAWLWRRLHGPDPDRTPRRLVYALPQRSLPEQVAGEARKWLLNLGLTEQVALHVPMSGAEGSRGNWREDMHRPAIVVGTVDSLVSKALNRGYGVGRVVYPIDFALVTNGAHWIIDEIGLCPQAATTMRRITGFASALGSAEPFGLTRMTAAGQEAPGDAVWISPAERTGELAVRLGAERTIRRLDAEPGAYQAIAAAIRERHRPGTLTLVAMNTVEAAREVYQQLRNGPGKLTLLHSRFRGIERARLVAAVIDDPDDRIVVATRVVEAGIDVNASVLVTEAAPWPSLVQRAGRCNRTGRVEDAELWWVPPERALPGEQAGIDATCAELQALQGRKVTGEILLGCRVDVAGARAALAVRDLLRLFDTSAGPNGADEDIAPHVRDAEDLDAEIAWATWTPADGGAPDPGVRAPSAEYRCRVPVGMVNDLADSVPVWRPDHVLGTWTRVSGQAPARPGEALLISAADGAYDPETGFDPAVRGVVPEGPVLATDPASEEQSEEQRAWITLDQHSREVRDQAGALLRTLQPGLPPGTAETVVLAAYLHDVGKAHPIWQDALCELASAGERDRIQAGRPWAKSGGKGGRLIFAGGAAFRHELASLLLIDGPLRAMADGAADPDLLRYLVLAHHGRLRVQVRDLAGLGLEHGAATPVPPMLGQAPSQLTVDLGQFEPGGERSWTRTVLELRDRYGPFTLAYLETLVRIADWRASGGVELPG